jgi:sec-independent protein translocase protein TatA
MFDSPLKDSIIVLIILLLFFGPKRLPALSRSIGESIKEFRGGVGEARREKKELKEAPAAAVTTPAQQPEGAQVAAATQAADGAAATAEAAASEPARTPTNAQ